MHNWSVLDEVYLDTPRKSRIDSLEQELYGVSGISGRSRLGEVFVDDPDQTSRIDALEQTTQDADTRIVALEERAPVPGPRGEKGEKGDPGDDGVDGSNGRDGVDGAEGPAGPKGDTGNTGAQGDPGVHGERGLTGATGAKGDTGEQGIQGYIGGQGIQGEQGTQGEQGLSAQEITDILNRVDNKIENEISSLGQRLSAGIASSLALSSHTHIPGKDTTISLGVGHYSSEFAVGFKFSNRNLIENNRVIIYSMGVSYNSYDRTAVSAGVSLGY